MRKKGTKAPPRLTLASERSEAEIAAERRRYDAESAAEALNYAARDLAANALRVIAGAGRIHRLIEETIALLTAYRELQPYAGAAAYRYRPVVPMEEGRTDLDWRKNDPAYLDSRSEETQRRWLEDGTEEVRWQSSGYLEPCFALWRLGLAGTPRRNLPPTINLSRQCSSSSGRVTNAAVFKLLAHLPKRASDLFARCWASAFHRCLSSALLPADGHW